MSKGYSMPGWRVGFVVGNRRLVGALTRIKSYLDYGMFPGDPGRRHRRPQRAAARGGRGGRDLSEAQGLPRRRIRPHRVGVREAEGDDVRVGAHSRTVPGDGLRGVFEASPDEGQGRGLAGDRLRGTREGFVRFALVENEHRIRQAIRGVKGMLQSPPKVKAK